MAIQLALAAGTLLLLAVALVPHDDDNTVRGHVAKMALKSKAVQVDRRSIVGFYA